MPAICSKTLVKLKVPGIPYLLLAEPLGSKVKLRGLKKSKCGICGSISVTHWNYDFVFLTFYVFWNKKIVINHQESHIPPSILEFPSCEILQPFSIPILFGNEIEIDIVCVLNNLRKWQFSFFLFSAGGPSINPWRRWNVGRESKGHFTGWSRCAF